MIETGIPIIEERAGLSSRFVLAGDWQERRSYRPLLHPHLNQVNPACAQKLGEGTAAMNLSRVIAYE